MATPYLQLREEEVPSTQDRARAELDRLPVVVMAQRQTAGRGRSGAGWLTAPRAVAVSLAVPAEADPRPFSLMAAVAAGRSLEELTLKWPNDLIRGDLKVGGILVERSNEAMVVGLGVNLWWPDPPPGFGALNEEDPGPDLHASIAGLWAAEMMALVDADGWPLPEYRSRCVTLGRDITWEPEGRGRAVDIAEGGELVVDVDGGRQTIRSGAIRHIRA